MNPTRSARTSRRFSSLVACGGVATADGDEDEDVDEADEAVALGPPGIVGCADIVGCAGWVGCDGIDGWEIGRGGPLLSIRKLAPFSSYCAPKCTWSAPSS
jgi:hypothetical protein